MFTLSQTHQQQKHKNVTLQDVKMTEQQSRVCAQREVNNRFERSVAAHIELCSFPKVFLCFCWRVVNPVLA